MLAHSRLGWPLQATLTRRDGYEPEEIYAALPLTKRLRQPALSAVTLPSLLANSKKLSANGLSPRTVKDPELTKHILLKTYLAHVRALLQKRGEWDSSTIFIMGDHSWRTRFIWSKMGRWTREDKAASHGAQFDDRSGYLVKLPNQQQGARIDAPFKAIHTRALFDALLAHQLHTPEALNTWVKKQK